ncbi:MAG: rhodanese-like domain-containing protein [Pseudomonadota bacterium]
MASKVTRRALIASAGLTLTGVGLYASWRSFLRNNAFVVPTTLGIWNLPADEANTRREAGEILLIDVRRPEEWRSTGIAKGAVPVDMRRSDFVETVRAVKAAAGGKPVALICARGVRSLRMAEVLLSQGLSPLFNIPEGMLGTRDAPGWILRGLPLQPWPSSAS